MYLFVGNLWKHVEKFFGTRRTRKKRSQVLKFNMNVPNRSAKTSCPPLFPTFHKPAQVLKSGFWSQTCLGSWVRVVSWCSNSQDLCYTPAGQVLKVWAKNIHSGWRNFDFSILPQFCVSIIKKGRFWVKIEKSKFLHPEWIFFAQTFRTCPAGV